MSIARPNTCYLVASIVFPLLIWIIFKTLYPYPFITIDSYYYIGAAFQNANAGSWPIGYSKFIQLVGLISHSPTLLVSAQYVILQISFILFFFSVKKLFPIGKWASLVLFIFLFLNPLFIYGSNHIMSDILFTGLTILWVTNLLWILKSPQPYMLFTQAILLLLIFTIRYTALYFPLFTIIVFLISHQPTWRKITGIGLTLLLLASFIQFTRIKMAEIAGIPQFSSASGWKQASNALYMYRHIAATDNTPVPNKFKQLHQFTKNYFQGPHTLVDLYHIDQEFTTGSFYVAAHESPLMQYLRIKLGENADIFDFKNIAPFGPLFNSYGTYLILHHPFPYLQHVVLPDITAYLYPFPEIYGTPDDLYFIWPNYMGDMAKSWFKLTTVTIPKQRIQIRGTILNSYPALFFLVHILFIIMLIISPMKRCLNFMSLLCIANFIFTIFSAASVLRFQFSFVILEFTIVIYLIEKYVRKLK